jgi:hypothetical protein
VNFDQKIADVATPITLDCGEHLHRAANQSIVASGVSQTVKVREFR